MSDPAPPPAKKKKSFAPLLLAVAAFAGGGGGAVMAVMTLAPGGAGKAEAPAAVASPVEYVEIDNAFTSNLSDTGRYLQLRIAVSTTGGLPVTAALTQHKPALVSAVLGVLGEAGEADVADRAAKAKLRAAVRTAINDVLRKNAHVAVDDVFFTSLVVQ